MNDTEIKEISIKVFDLIKEELQELAKVLFNDAMIEAYKKERDYISGYVWRKVEPRINEIRKDIKSETWGRLNEIEVRWDTICDHLQGEFEERWNNRW